MWLLIILLALGLLLCWLPKIFRKDYETGWGVASVVTGLITVFMLSWMVPMIAGGPIADSKYIYTEIRTATLLSIKDNSVIEGSMFLLAGSVGEQTYYFYYIQSPDGSIELKKTPTDYIKLFEDSSENDAYILKKVKLIPQDVVKAEKWVFYPQTYIVQSKEIHVPPGTVLRQFVLDAE